jgi:acetyltransferase-like isoleucine patch superfamily enzyme
MKTVKKIIAILISIMPGNSVRIFLYRNMLGYKISYNSQIGFFNLINVTNCDIEGGRIGMFNTISCKTLAIGKNSYVNKYNRIRYVNFFLLGENCKFRNNNSVFGTVEDGPYKQYEGLSIKNGCTVTSGHVFDCSDSILIGSKVIIGGKASQFWTHGFTNDEVKVQGPIILEDDIYIGSRCLFMPGIKVCGDNYITSGTTVSKSILESGVYASSKLMKIGELKKLYNTEGVTVYNKRRYLRKEVN